MREILFRGQRKDTGMWVCGDLLQGGIDYDIAIREKKTNAVVAVSPETVGQFSGLVDKDGKKIFEGDVILIPYDYGTFGHNAGKMYEIYFGYGGFRLKPKYSKKARGYWLEDDKTFKVFGNVYDNPGLLED